MSSIRRLLVRFSPRNNASRVWLHKEFSGREFLMRCTRIPTNVEHFIVAPLRRFVSVAVFYRGRIRGWMCLENVVLNSQDGNEGGEGREGGRRFVKKQLWNGCIELQIHLCLYMFMFVKCLIFEWQFHFATFIYHYSEWMETGAMIYKWMAYVVGLSARLCGHTTCFQLFIYACHNCDSSINFITFLIYINAISIVYRIAWKYVVL